MSDTTGAPSEARKVGTDDLTYGQPAAARKAVRHLLDCGVLEPVEHADLAILIAYTCQVRPALARAGELPAGAALAPARPAPGDIASLAAADPGFAAWAQDDPYWRARLEIAVAIRLLGNISVQLATAPADPGLRAAVVLSLYARQVRRISPLISGLSPGMKGHLQWATAS